MRHLKAVLLFLSLLLSAAPRFAPSLITVSGPAMSVAMGPALSALPAIAGASAIVAALAEEPEAATISGLNWNLSNNQTGSDIRMVWTSTNLVPRYPFTIIVQYRPHQQTGYYAAWWYSTADEAFHGGAEYNGSHPYPPGGSGGTTHKWELATDGGDFQSSQDVVQDVFYTQAFTVEKDGSNNLDMSYYWAIDSGMGATWLITREVSSGNLTSCACTETSTTYGAYAMTVGGSPWTQAPGGSVGDNSETLSGVLRNIQIYDTILSPADIATEAARSGNAAVTAVGGRHLWYSNVNPTPSDIADKSGNGHDPVWVNANRPTLWDSTVAGSVGAAFRGTLLGVGK